MKQRIECTAFEGGKRIAAGDLHEVAVKVHDAVRRRAASNVLIFDDATGEWIEVDLRGSARDVLRRLDDETAAGPAGAEEPVARRPGRPKLGVVAREVTLLPRHWEWLNLQPGGASVALRKLIDEARRVHRNTDQARRAKEAAYRFMSAIAGDEPGFEETTRGLFSGDAIRFAHHSRNWPADVREYAAKLAARAFEGEGSR
jgi:hypothetical protein